MQFACPVKGRRLSSSPPPLASCLIICTQRRRRRRGGGRRRGGRSGHRRRRIKWNSIADLRDNFMFHRYLRQFQVPGMLIPSSTNQTDLLPACCLNRRFVCRLGCFRAFSSSLFLGLPSINECFINRL